MIKDVLFFSPCQQNEAVIESKLINSKLIEYNLIKPQLINFNLIESQLIESQKLIKYKLISFFWLVSLGFLLAIIVSGCSVLNSLDEEFHSGKRTLEVGEDAFMNENYLQAEICFRKVIDNSKNPWDKNRAIYNLACTKLITSKNDSEFIEATEILKQWQPSRNIPMYYENPKLIVKALLKSNDLLDEKGEEFKGFSPMSYTQSINDMHDLQEIDAIVKETNQMNTRLDRLLREQDGKIKTLNNIVKRQNEKIKLLNAIFKKESKTKEDMEETIGTLKHQISELERIDRKLQNKRKTQ